MLLSVLWVFPSWHFSLYSELTDSVSLSLSVFPCLRHSLSPPHSSLTPASLLSLPFLSLPLKHFFTLANFQFLAFSFRNTHKFCLWQFSLSLSFSPSTHAPVVASFLLLFHHFYLFLLLFFVVVVALLCCCRHVALKFLALFSFCCCCPSVSLAFVRVHWQFLPLVLFVACLASLLSSPLPPSSPLSLSLYLSQFDRLTALAKLLFGTNFVSCKTLLNTASPLPFPPPPRLVVDLHQSINRSISRSIQSVNTFSICTRLTNKFLFSPPKNTFPLLTLNEMCGSLSLALLLCLPATHFPLLAVSLC